MINWDDVERTPVMVLRDGGYRRQRVEHLYLQVVQRLTPAQHHELMNRQEHDNHRDLAQLLAYLDWTGRP